MYVAPATQRRSRTESGVGSSSAGHPAPSWTPLHWMLALMILTYVWRIQDVFPVLGAIKITILATLTAFALFLVSGVGISVFVRRDPVFRAILFILAMMVLSVPGGVYPGFSFRFIIEDHIKTFAFAVMLIGAVTHFCILERLALAHVLGAVVYCLMSLLYGHIGADGKLNGVVYYDANDLALLAVCSIPLALYFMRSDQASIIRIIGLIGAVVLALTAVRTGSRGGFLGLLVVLLSLLVGYRAVSTQIRLGAVAGVVAFVLIVGSEGYLERMESLLNPQEDYNWAGNSATGRAEVWKRGVGYLLSDPFTGVGVSAFHAAEGLISFREMAELGRGMKWSAAHNSFIQIGAELGVPGLIAFMLSLYFAYRNMRRIGRTSTDPSLRAMAQLLSSVLAGYTVSAFFLSHAYSPFLYTTLAFVVALTGRAAIAASPAAAVASPPPLHHVVRDRRPIHGRGGGWTIPGSAPT